MAKFLTRIGTDKFYCQVNIKVAKVSMKVDMPSKI